MRTEEKKREILEKVEELEYERRCIKHKICPDCGGILSDYDSLFFKSSSTPKLQCDDCYEKWNYYVCR